MKRIFAALLGLLLAPAIFANTLTVLPQQTVALIGPVTQSSAAVVVDRIHLLNRGRDLDPIYLVINSPGGDVLAGFQIIQAMEASRRPVYTVDVGFAASMAAIIHAYGVQRYMTPKSALMYHQITMSFDGDVSLTHLAVRLHFIQQYEEMANEQIAAVSGVPIPELQAREQTEWWVLVDEATKRRLVDAVVQVPDYPTSGE